MALVCASTFFCGVISLSIPASANTIVIDLLRFSSEFVGGGDILGGAPSFIINTTDTVEIYTSDPNTMAIWNIIGVPIGVPPFDQAPAGSPGGIGGWSYSNGFTVLSDFQPGGYGINIDLTPPFPQHHTHCFYYQCAFLVEAPAVGVPGPNAGAGLPSFALASIALLCWYRRSTRCLV
jgi:hypothetical protein